MADRHTVLLLIPHLGGGGAERVIACLARGLSHEKYDLHLVLITQAEAATERLPAHVKIHCLGVRRVRYASVRLLRLVRKLKPHLILSGIAHLNFLVLALRPFFPRRTRVLVRQSGSLTAAARSTPGLTRALYRVLYPSADCVICQTDAMSCEISAALSSRIGRRVLPNPVDITTIRAGSPIGRGSWTNDGPNVLAVGRLVREKGFDLLLEAFVAVIAQCPAARLTILGKGPEEATLRAQCRTLDIETAVRFAGFTANSHEWFGGATLFVLASRDEGLPNALLEAAAGGLPIVALPASAGLTELIANQPGIWPAPEISAGALAESLLQAVRSLRPGERFRHAWIEQFSMERAIARYEELIDAALNGTLR